jgi:hypothetical protein
MKKFSVPFGRVPEVIDKLSEDERGRTAIRVGKRIGDNDLVQVWPNRKVMARFIRRDEKDKPVSDWRAVIKLSDGEGY